MAQVDPFAGYEDRGAPQQPVTPAAAGPDPFAGAEDLGPGAAPSVEVSGRRAGLEGYLDTAGFGFRDEVKAASEASGLPVWLGGFRSPIGGAKLLYEHETGQRGPATETYERELKKARELQRAAKEQHPEQFIAGQVAGALVGPGFGAGTGATVGARAARSALAGAAQGGAYGFGSGEGGAENRVKQAAIGAGIGGVGGAILSPVADIATAGLTKGGELGKSVYNTIRAEFNPATVEDVAAAKTGGAALADMSARGGQPTFTPEEYKVAQEAGTPISTVDVLGERGRSLARTAADTSPEARAALAEKAQETFAGQSRRIGGFIKGMTGGADPSLTRESIEDVARRANRAAYAKLYAQNSRDITSPVLEELKKAPAVQSVMRDVAVSGQNRAIGEGLRNFDPNKRNMQFWDYAYRDLRDQAPNNPALWGIVNRLRDELDSKVPDYAATRAGAAHFFGAKDALEAGQKFVDMKGSNTDFARQVAKMSDPERKLFAQGFASHLADRILGLRNSENVITKAFLESPAAKERIRIALGPQNADRLEALLRVEAQVDKLRQAMGNSKTNQFQLARTLTNLGAAGGGGLEAYEAAKEAFGEGGFDPEKLSTGHLLGSAILFGSLYGKGRMEAVNEEVARRVGQMLASDDPAILRRGIDMVTKSRPLMQAIRNMGRGVAQGTGGAGRRLVVRVPGPQGTNVAPQTQE